MARISRPPDRRQGTPFRVLVSLLYCRFQWAVRHPDGALTADSTRFAQALGLRTHRLHAALAFLKEAGYLDRLIWHRGWFLAQPLCPPCLERPVGEAIPAQFAPTPEVSDAP